MPPYRAPLELYILLLLTPAPYKYLNVLRVIHVHLWYYWLLQILHVLCQQPTDASSPSTGAVAMTSENIDMTLGEQNNNNHKLMHYFELIARVTAIKITTTRAQQKPQKIHLLSSNSSAGAPTNTRAHTHTQKAQKKKTLRLIHTHAYPLTHAWSRRAWRVTYV